ncbi:ImmA/IrrE family metallo-endopeptidase [Variovorax sp. N23]|uniref:ImmA/IrrE family metallo-endopeptidase n=1 Tax=Variovorax sp. N23 TaxID=2980555 RepID=UPI0021C8DB26|nr:ImmA/IrrE family metallo-endopeptidase [Variovorax sp. N23]MCU4119123.1 ImmA/IrrE family metallo-endopeptidase [Variovorax sp. N23]
MRRPEELLERCYVDSPDDIDLEVIAFEAGLEVRDRALTGCEASLVGYGDKGIVTVTTGVSPERRRFSIAHEIGHWEQHRGQSFSCRIEERALDKAAKSKEREADDYASTLMMPTGLFKEAIQMNKGSVSLSLVSKLAATFRSSFPAAAIRYVELSGEPVVLVFTGVGNARRWTSRSRRVPEHLWIKTGIDGDSFASDLVHATELTKRQGKMPAEAWFDSVSEDRNLQEHSIRFAEGIYTLLHLTDEELLEERMSAKRAWRNRE